MVHITLPLPRRRRYKWVGSGMKVPVVVILPCGTTKLKVAGGRPALSTINGTRFSYLEAVGRAFRSIFELDAGIF